MRRGLILIVITAAILFANCGRDLCFTSEDRTSATRAQINAFLTALGAYQLDTGEFPTTAQGLAALRLRPGGVHGWQGPYLPNEIPLDPWGRNYVYLNAGTPAVTSFGSDGVPGGVGLAEDVAGEVTK